MHYQEWPEKLSAKQPSLGTDYHTGKFVQAEPGHSVMIVGSTGSGKTATALIPSILSCNTGSKQVVDIKSHELLLKTHDLHNKNSVVVDFDSNADFVWGWDIFYKLRKDGTDTEQEVLEVIREVASIIIPNTEGGEQFWIEAARNEFIALAIFQVCYKREKKPYEHVDFVSAITQEDCFICGKHSDPLTAAYWQQDNVAILDLNTFELLRLEINRYGDHGELITTEAGYMQSCGMDTETGHIHSYVHPDRGYANVDISGVAYSIDRDSVQSNLCQTCLDSINSEWFGDDPPAELAVVNFAENTLRPLITCTTGFGAGNFYVDCDFREDGRIDLLIFYCPARYAATE